MWHHVTKDEPAKEELVKMQAKEELIVTTKDEDETSIEENKVKKKEKEIEMETNQD